MTEPEDERRRLWEHAVLQALESLPRSTQTSVGAAHAAQAIQCGDIILEAWDARWGKRPPAMAARRRLANGNDS